MTTTFTAVGIDISGSTSSFSSSTLEITFADDVTALSYDIIDRPDGSVPIVDFDQAPVRIEVDGFSVTGSSFPSAADLPIGLGFLNWSGGSTLIALVLIPSPFGTTTLSYGLFELGGAPLPATALAFGYFGFLSFLENDFAGNVPTNLFSEATGAFGEGSLIPIDSLNWDSVVDNVLPGELPSPTNGDDSIVAGITDTNDLTILGLAGNDTLGGGAGDDTLIGGNGGDLMNGEGGADSLVGGGGFDTVNGGSGNDRIFGDANVDQLFGGDGNDYIVGGTGADRLEGGAGRDTLLSGSEADRVEGGEGNDLIRLGTNFGGSKDGGNGDAGNDTIFGEGGFDILLGGDGEDSLMGGNQADNLFGNDGLDTLWGGAGQDRVFGNAGDDVLYGEDGNDRIVGGSGDDTASGGLGDDNISGGTGDDNIDGGEGNDRLSGGAGMDTIFDGTGDDTINGGGDFDQFVFSFGHGNDTITDFEVGVDYLDLFATGLTFEEVSDSFGAPALSEVDGNTVVTTSTGNTVTLEGVALADFDSSFIFTA